MGPSYLYDHLVPNKEVDSLSDQRMDMATSLLEIVCRILGLKAEEISIDVPLTTYGLDSLSAAALSFALRPLLVVSQVQLLVDVTIRDLQARLVESTIGLSSL